MERGHPQGLYRLFFIEMWERLAFYTMLNVLLLYATDFERGGLGLTSSEGNEIYGLYLAFVYFTPFPGGLLADRYIGYRKAVFIGALLMATGLFLMGTPGWSFFISGLVLLILGNGFFKPNISVMVGNLYEAGDPRRDSGFNIFYMGINIGAFAASFLSSAVRNEAGWLWTFRVAGLGLLVGTLILLLSWKTLAKADRRSDKKPEGAGFGAIFVRILLPAFGAGLVGYVLTGTYFPGAPVSPGVAGFLFGMVPVLAYFWRLGRTTPPSERPGLQALLPVYLAGGTFFMILHLNGSAMTQWARDNTDRQSDFVPARFKQEALPSYYLNAGEDVPRPDPRSLLVVDSDEAARMYGQQRLDGKAIRAIAAAARDVEVREFAADDTSSDPEVLRRAAKVYADGTVTVKQVSDGHGGTAIAVQIPDGAKPERQVAFVRLVDGVPVPAYVVDRATYAELYDGYAKRYGHAPVLLPAGVFLSVVNPELFQAFNALFVIAFTPLVVAFFAWRARKGRGISTARKIFYGLIVTTLSLLVMAVAGLLSEDGAVKVGGIWLVGFYAVVTLAELMLSPMGLSLVTKLTPARLVGVAMGGWFMATAFGNNLSGFFGGIQGMLSPVNFFLLLAGLAGLAAAFIRFLLPKLEKTLKQYGA